jgi:hypothetical protein
MSDDPEAPERAESSPPVPVLPPPRPGFVRRHWGKLLLLGVIVVPGAIFTLWAGITLSYSYSSGERVGYVQKLSRKGWLCKTWEGELQRSTGPGSAPLLFQFSVRSDSVARAIQGAEGRRVALEYDQHIGVPTKCFGETEYYVTGVRVVSP